MIYFATIIDGGTYRLFKISPNGKKQWHRDFSRALFSPVLTSDGGSILIGEYSGGNYKAYALNANDGTIFWTTNGGGRPYTIDKERNLVYAIKKEAANFASYKIVALDLDSGIKAWETASWIHARPTGMALGPSPTRALYVGCLKGGVAISGELIKIRPENGAVIWEKELGNVDRGEGIPRYEVSPVSGADGLIYYTISLDGVYCIQPDGTILWHYRSGNNYVPSSPLINKDGRLIVAISHNQSSEGILLSFKKYQGVILNIKAGSGGTTDPVPGSSSYNKGSRVKVTAIPNANCEFVNWSGDILSTQNPVTVTMDSNKTIKANFRLKPKLTIQSSRYGTTDPSPGVHYYATGTQARISAIPDTYCTFINWSGNGSGSTNPLSLTMNGNKSISASFRIISAPIATGRKVLNRSFSQAEYINILSWQGNPTNQGLDITKYRIYLMNNGTLSLLAEVGADVTEYSHRKAGQGSLQYAIAAVTSSGREGAPALVSVQ